MNIREDDPNDVEEERSPERENALTGGSDPAREAEAAECIELVLHEPAFGIHWTAKAYNQEYYSPLSAADRSATAAIRQATRQEGWKSVVDILEVKALAPEARTESLENIAMGDFDARSLPKIFEAYPNDHLSVFDVGGGSNAVNDIAFMTLADSIIHSEYLADNREEMRKWKRGESDFDCGSFIDHFRSYAEEHPEIFSAASPEVRRRISELLSKDVAGMENVLRNKIKEIVPVDVFQKDLGHKLEPDAQFDIVNLPKWGSVQLVTSNFCIESATASMEKWRAGMDNIAAKVAPGGFLLMKIIRNAQWYKVGKGRESAVPINAEILRDGLIARGFMIEEMTELVGSDKETVGYDGMVFALARKPVDPVADISRVAA